MAQILDGLKVSQDIKKEIKEIPKSSVSLVYKLIALLQKAEKHLIWLQF